MAGTIKSDYIQSELGTPTVFRNVNGAEIGRLGRSWLKYNCTAASVYDSFNVSSVTKAATGAFAPSMTIAMADGNHSVICSTCRENGESDFRGACVDLNSSYSSSSFRIALIYAGTTLTDRTLATVLVAR